MSDLDPEAQEFDAEAAVEAYRETIAKLDTATDEEELIELRREAQRQRKAWTRWQGEDSLFEMAFGEPWGE